MADKDSAPTFNPRHRIIGAVIVVSLAVILVPIILDRREPPAELKNPSAARDSKPGETRVVVTPVGELGAAPAKPVNQPVADKPASSPVVAARPVTDPVPAATRPDSPAEQPSAPVAEPAPAPPAREAPAKTATKTDSQKTEKLKKGWVVQVGVYSNTDNAERMTARIKALGIKVSSEPITLSGNKATRLRVGPYRDRATAERQQGRIQKELGEKVSVVAWP